MRELLNIPEGRDGFCLLHCAGGRGRRTHSHAELEINLVISGRGQYLIDGQPVPLSAGTLLWLSPKQAHLLSEENSDFIMWVAVLRAGALSEAGASCSLRTSPDDTAFFDMLFRKLHEADSDEIFNDGVFYLFRQVRDMCERQSPVSRQQHPAVVRAVRIMTKLDDAVDVETIARHAGMSRSQLSRLFKKQTGFTLVEYRQKIQLERFLLLCGDGRTLLEAALDAGFGSYPQFYRVFQQRFGCSPREYFRQTGL
ncbi:AraC family transcriptional regulator [Tichowtungia aerotolerans]|uniref:AraC family transcriptional regulator n=1 Tax=Tichowtungia aerotolerans TaxID=2697043 RepID=UPI001E464147|nr:AraC family transcriptional regulator [Tichowtungia aerotolerans]